MDLDLIWLAVGQAKKTHSLYKDKLIIFWVRGTG